MPRPDQQVIYNNRISANTQNVDATRIIYPARVVNNVDPQKLNRIQARIIMLDQYVDNIDRDVPDDKLPYAIPLLNPFIQMTPQKDELVLLIVDNIQYINATRFYLYPINIPFDRFTHYTQATTIFDQQPNTNNIPELSLPQHNKDPYDITVNGKKDASIFFKDRNLILTVGKFLDMFCTKENINHPCFIELKNHEQAEIKLQANNIFLNTDKHNNTYYYHVAKAEIVIEILMLIAQILITHIHAPQTSPLLEEKISQLIDMLQQNYFQNIIAPNIHVK